MAEQIDIEAALHWAFGVVQVDRLAARLDRFGRDNLAILAEIGLPKGPSFRSASDMMRHVSSLGTLVQEGGGVRSVVPTAGGGAIRAKAEDGDALTILDAVTELPSIWLELTDDGVVLWDLTGAESAGAEIVTKGGSWLRRHEDWVKVEDAGVLAAVVGNARLGVSAAWDVVTLDLAVTARRGRPSAEDLARQNDQWRRLVLARAKWGAWRMSLEWLVARLAGRLSTMEVTGPAIPRAPWSVVSLAAQGEGISEKCSFDKSLKRRNKKTS